MNNSSSKPWLNRRIWQAGKYRNNTFKSVVTLLILWLASALTAGYLMYAVGLTLYSGEFKMSLGSVLFVLLLFAGIPVLLVYFFRYILKIWRRWKLWGNCLFEHFTQPAFLGEQLEGKLMLPERIYEGEKLSYSLGCFRQRRYERERVGKKGIVVWKSDVVTKAVAPGMQSISIQIQLPKSRPESNWSGQYGHIKWLLSVNTTHDKFEDIDYEVPVFFNPDAV